MLVLISTVKFLEIGTLKSGHKRTIPIFLRKNLGIWVISLKFPTGVRKKKNFFLPEDKLKPSNYLLLKEDDVRKTGRFPKQQQKTKMDFFNRRADGGTVSTMWLRCRMAFHCKNDL